MMDSLADPYLCLLRVRMGLAAGESLRSSLQAYAKGNQSAFSCDLNRWILQGAATDKLPLFHELRKNSYRLAIVHLLAAGLKGQSIYDPLLSLEQELHQASLDELEEEIRMQPIKLIFPLLFFQLPAFFILLFGPVTAQLLQTLTK